MTISVDTVEHHFGVSHLSAGSLEAHLAVLVNSARHLVAVLPDVSSLGAIVSASGA